jgi:hypothetical protein
MLASFSLASVGRVPCGPSANAVNQVVFLEKLLEMVAPPPLREVGKLPEGPGYARWSSYRHRGGVSTQSLDERGARAVQADILLPCERLVMKGFRKKLFENQKKGRGMVPRL